MNLQVTSFLDLNGPMLKSRQDRLHSPSIAQAVIDPCKAFFTKQYSCHETALSDSAKMDR